MQVALDFVNTLEHSRDGDTEHLPSPASLVRWLEGKGLVGEGEASSLLAAFESDGRQGELALMRARGLRRALRCVIDARIAGSRARQRDLDVIDRWLRRRPPLHLVEGAQGLALVPGDGEGPIAVALARIAEAGAHVVTESDHDRLRACANHDCRWVFYDTSRGGRRRWCDMSSCGNRAKARRHRERVSGTPR